MELKTVRCGDCNTRIVIMRTQTGNILPVEVEPGKHYDDDDTFDHLVHKSHLLNCIPLRLRWADVQRKYFKKLNAKFKW
jgi:hypothetical protein